MAKRGAVYLVTYSILKLIARKHALYALYENKVVSGWKPRQKTMHFTSELVSYFLGTIFEKLQDQVNAANYKHKPITGIQTLTLSCWTTYATFRTTNSNRK